MQIKLDRRPRSGITNFRARLPKNLWVKSIFYLAGIALFLLLIMAILLLGAFEARNYKPFYESSLGRFANFNISSIPSIFHSQEERPEKMLIEISREDLSRIKNIRDESQEKSLDAKLVIQGLISYKQAECSVSINLEGTELTDLSTPSRWTYHITTTQGKHPENLKISNFALYHVEDEDYLATFLGQHLFAERGIKNIQNRYVELLLNNKSLGAFFLQEYSKDDEINLENPNEPGFIFQIDREGNILSPLKILPSDFVSRWNSFRSGNNTIESVLNIEKMAKFHAIWDLAYHGAMDTIENSLYFYNARKGLVEPIAIPPSNISQLNEAKFQSFVERSPENNNRGIAPIKDHILKLLSNSPDFHRFYASEAAAITQDDYLNDFCYRHRKQITQLLKHRKSSWFIEDDPQAIKLLFAAAKYLRYLLYPDQIELSAYLKDISNDQITVEVKNHQRFPIKLLDVTWRDSMKFYPVGTSLVVSSRPNQENIREYNFKMQDPSQWHDTLIPELELEFALLGILENKRRSLIFPWPHASRDKMTINPASRFSTYERFSFIDSESPTELRIGKGKWEIPEDLVIPKEKTLRLEPGVHLNLINHSKIISYSPIFSMGSSKDPVIITSTDTSGMGLIVIDASSTSILQNTNFSHLSCTDDNGYKLTGAVTFYESPVKISLCNFSDNKNGDDCLNIIRTTFDIDYTNFENIRADALDADFCTGTVSNCQFLNVGNDCIDVSGSKLKVNHILMRKVGDKGLSAGEDSEVDAKDLDIFNAEIALTSKDRSRMKVYDALIYNSTIGIALYQKKSEYGPAYLNVQQLDIEQSEIQFLVEENSHLVVDGHDIAPNKINVKDILYGIEYGKSSRGG